MKDASHRILKQSCVESLLNLVIGYYYSETLLCEGVVLSPLLSWRGRLTRRPEGCLNDTPRVVSDLYLAQPPLAQCPYQTL